MAKVLERKDVFYYLRKKADKIINKIMKLYSLALFAPLLPSTKLSPF